MSDENLIIRPKTKTTFQEPKWVPVVLGGHPVRYIEQPGMVMPVTKPNPANPTHQILDPATLARRVIEMDCVCHALMRETTALRDALTALANAVCLESEDTKRMAGEIAAVLDRRTVVAQDADTTDEDSVLG